MQEVLDETPRRPVVFKNHLVLQIEAGVKTETRRVMKPQPERQDDAWYWKSPRYDNGDGVHYFHTKDLEGIMPAWARACPFGVPGDQLWVKEKWRVCNFDRRLSRILVAYGDESQVWHDASPEEMQKYATGKWAFKSGRFMPKFAARMLLEVTEVNVERVQDLTGEDAIKEGMVHLPKAVSSFDKLIPELKEEYRKSALSIFSKSWEKLNGPRGFGWEADPFVWVVKFKKL